MGKTFPKELNFFVGIIQTSPKYQKELERNMSPPIPISFNYDNKNLHKPNSQPNRGSNSGKNNHSHIRPQNIKVEQIKRNKKEFHNKENLTKKWMFHNEVIIS